MLWKMTSRLPLGVFKTKSYLYAAVTLSNTRGLMLFVRPKTHTIEYRGFFFFFGETFSVCLMLLILPNTHSRSKNKSSKNTNK